jgi:hypothetical protein
MEKSSQIAWKIVPLRHSFPRKVVPLIEGLLYVINALSPPTPSIRSHPHQLSYREGGGMLLLEREKNLWRHLGQYANLLHRFRKDARNFGFSFTGEREGGVPLAPPFFSEIESCRSMR